VSENEKTIRVEREGGIATVVLDRPQRANTINLQLTVELNDALDELDRDSNVHCIFVTGAGDRHFCGGADLREIDRLISPDGVVGDRRRDFICHIEEVSKPVIAVINGAAMGGGCEIALACDFRVMADDVQIGLPEVRFGALPAGGGTQRLPRLVGLAKARELILTGKHLSAAEALAIGLVDRIAPRAQLIAKARELADQFKDKAPYAIATAKRLLNQALEVPLAQGLELERRMVRDMGTPQEREEFRKRSMRANPTYESIFSPNQSSTKAGASR
jgi:methylglutaconyl-CoA hydratase